MNTIFRVSERGGNSLRILDEGGRLLRDIPRVVTSGEACRRLHRSRRHLYRCIRRGWLRPVAKFSNELFFDVEDVSRLQKAPRRHASPPASMTALFPEYEIQSLHAERDADLILSRILERGSFAEVRWALRHYSKGRRRRFLKRVGPRLLSARAQRFWSWLWGVRAGSYPHAWRKAGFGPGGIF